LDAVRHDTAATFDLAVGFWQIGLDEATKRFFRVRDNEGRVFQATRLPMGHCVSVDIMQLVTKVIAGSPLVCTPRWSNKLLPDVWVDGARFAGSAKAVEKAANFCRSNATDVRATFKDGLQIGEKYEFIGVAFDHVAHEVKVASKTATALAHPVHTLQDLEKHVGRLIFASAVTRLPLAQFYLALKWAKRKINLLNRSILHLDSPVEVPPSVRREFSQWLSLAFQPRQIAPGSRNSTPNRMTIFSDASKSGWGAVLIDSHNRVLVSGGEWRSEKTISALEVEAIVLALTAFHGHLKAASRIDIKVDNTSAEWALRKGSAATSLVPPLLRALTILRSLDVPVSVAYIKSKDNPADLPSRGPVTEEMRLTIEKKAVEFAHSKGFSCRTLRNGF
jgi:hypothetical protein